MCGPKIKISEANYLKIKEICASFNNNPGELINVLHKTQEHFGYLPEEVQQVVADCLGTACYVKGAEKILDALKSELKISEGGVTDDGKFSLDVLRCVGACGLAPVMTINGKTYGRLVPEQVKNILAEYAD